MTKKLLIALADAIKGHNKKYMMIHFESIHIETLADFCQKANPKFKRQRWLSYIKGECGKNGGKA